MRTKEAEIVESELQAGKSPRQIAKQHGLNRAGVKTLADVVVSNKQRDRITNGAKWLVAIAIVALIAGGIYYSTSQDPTDQEVRTAVVQAMEKLDSRTVIGDWHFERAGETYADVGGEAQFVADQARKLNESLDKNAIIPEVGELKKLFGGKLSPTVFVSTGNGGVTRQFVVGNSLTIPQQILKPENLEVVFYGQEDYANPKINSNLLFYDPEWRSLVLAGFKFSSNAWFDAMLCHELWHAKLHREGATSSTAHPSTDEWVDEEVAAHAVERKVLTHRNGIYGDRLLAYAKAHREFTLKRFIVGITGQDIWQLDELFERPTTNEQGMRIAQYFSDLAMVWLEQNYEGSMLAAKKREAYRVLSVAYRRTS